MLKTCEFVFGLTILYMPNSLNMKLCVYTIKINNTLIIVQRIGKMEFSDDQVPNNVLFLTHYTITTHNLYHCLH